MDIPGSTTDYQSALSATPIFSDNVHSFLGVSTLPKNPTAIITVNSTADVVDDSDGLTTLREAINRANADNGEDLIVFERSLFSTAQTITLTGGELDITHNLRIVAPRDTLTGGDLLTVSGNQTSRVFEVETGATVNLSGLIIADGKVQEDNGGGIKNSGILTLDNSIIRGSSATQGTATLGIYTNGFGGGIYNSGVIMVSNSIISNNFNSGIYNSDDANLTVSNSTISNSGIGIYNNDGANLIVSNSTISNGGTGIYNLKGGIIEVSNSTISANTAFNGGGIYNSGTSTVMNSTIIGNTAIDGGGIYNTGNGLSTVLDSTISNNSALLYGGGIFNDNSGNITVSNSTLSGNSATGGYRGQNGSGGGIFNDSSGNTTVSNSTLSGNSAKGSIGSIVQSFRANGGGIYISGSGNTTVSNSILSGNSATGSGLGGGIYKTSSGTFTLLFSTLTLNLAAKGGGVFDDNLSPLIGPSTSAIVRNTIIAANLNSDNGVNPDVSGTFSSNGYNLIGDGTGSTGFGTTGDIVGTSDFPIDPRLAPLDFYGGDTQTVALLPDSPAIDAASPTILDTDPTTDQRGFPRVINGRADIGAFEFSA